MPQCSSFSPLRDRPRRRSLTLANQASTRSIFINQPSCVRPHQSPHPPQPRRSVRSIPSPQLRRLLGRAQIPIAPAAPSRFPQRAFLPWRFSDAGRWSLSHHLRAAGIRKPSHNRTPALQNAMDYSITLSARRTSSEGISWPIALATCRLTTNSNLVGCSTGSSPGLAPRRTCASSRAN